MFTAAQAAQKKQVGADMAAELFTAAQAAQKFADDTSEDGAWFTAAQAAQKIENREQKLASEFTAAQAAQKKGLGKSCKTLRNVWYMSACNGILTGHEAKQP